MERPLIIVAKKPKDKIFSYIEPLKRLLREIYRIRGKGIPKPAHVTTTFEEIKFEVCMKEDIDNLIPYLYLVNFVWGKPKGVSGEETSTLERSFRGNLDSAAIELEETYYDRIEELANDVENILIIEPSGEDEESIDGESVTHFALKAFAVKHLIKNKPKSCKLF